MTEQEKPLHVRVAEALGWVEPELRFTWVATPPAGYDLTEYAKSQEPAYHGPHGTRVIPRFDTSWSATGPLVEKYGLQVYFSYAGDNSKIYSATKTFSARKPITVSGHKSFLLAACHLILELGEADALKDEHCEVCCA